MLGAATTGTGRFSLMTNKPVEVVRKGSISDGVATMEASFPKREVLLPSSAAPT